MKKAIRDYYSDQHYACKDVAFAECFPGGVGKVDLAYRLSIPVGIAASLLLIVMALLAYRNAPNFLADGDTTLADGSIREILQHGLVDSAVLGLSNAQASLLPSELSGFFATSLEQAQTDSMDAIKVKLMTKLLDSQALALTGDQAMAMTGLLGSWQPKLQAGMVVDDSWMTDDELASFVASCSTHCHGSESSQGLSAARLQGYLLNCLDSRSGAKCYAELQGSRPSVMPVKLTQETIKI